MHAALTEASLLLSILQESPSRLLGRLVFELGVSPQRLEHLMASFHHIHMMEVLVKCCCPQLPAHTSAVPARGECITLALADLGHPSSHLLCFLSLHLFFTLSPFFPLTLPPLPPRPSYHIPFFFCASSSLSHLPLSLALPVPEAVVALNQGEREGSLTDLCAFSEKLLTQLLSLLRGQCSLVYIPDKISPSSPPSLPPSVPPCVHCVFTCTCTLYMYVQKT